jgi:mono/diheme cytochrome c family protein
MLDPRHPWYAIVLALGLCSTVARAEPSSPARGQEVYRRLGCPACHSVAGVGNRRHPLDGVGGRLGPDDLRKWIVAPATMKPGVRKPAYDKTPKDDLDAVLEYLSTLGSGSP